MAGLVRVVIGLIFVWTLIAVTETAGVAILPRSAPASHLLARQGGEPLPFRGTTIQIAK